MVFTVDPGQKVTSAVVSDFRTNVLEQDDVFQPAFYTNIVFYGAEKSDDPLTSDAHDELAKWKTQHVHFLRGDADVAVPPGPYVFARGKTWQPWRTYYDTHACFMTSFKPSAGVPATLAAIEAPLGGLGGRVVIPSRCYYKRSESQPLHGARIAVKGNIDIAGHKTSLCNRAWLDLYPAKAEHAACVQTSWRPELSLLAN